MVKFNDNFLIALIFLSIIISAFSIFTFGEMGFGWGGISITGGATTGTGTANVTIGSSIDIVLLRSRVMFGSGSLSGATTYIATNADNPGAAGAFRDGGEGNGTTGTTVVYGSCDGTDTNCAFPVVVQNAGNINVSVNISASAAASSWIGGSNPNATFKGKNNESAACGQNFGAIGEGAAWVTIPTTPTVTLVCNNLSYSDAGSDEIRIHLNLTIPTDVVAGTKSVTLTIGSIAS